MCRNCGALVGAGESACAQCGAPLVSNAAAQQQQRAAEHRHLYDRETVRFARAVLARPHVFTIIFLVANFFVFLLIWHTSGQTAGALWMLSDPVLVAYGAKLNWMINLGHEYWRFVTPIFIHVGVVHLLVNMYSLWVIGPYVEKLYGSAKFVVFWVLTGVAGVLASYLTVRPDLHVGAVGRFLFKATDNPSAGASGALFGLIGVLFVFGIKFRHELPEGFKRAFGTGLLPTIMINLFIGYMGRGLIDNAAHLGGFVSGAALALVVGYKRPGQPAGVSIFWHALQVAALALVLVSFYMAARHFPSQLPTARGVPATNLLVGGAADFAANLGAINDAQGAFVNAFNKRDAGGIDGAVEKLDRAPRLDEETVALRDELKALLARVKDFAAEQPTAKGARDTLSKERARAAEREKLLSDFQSWQQRYEKWTDDESRKFGLKMQQKAPPNQDEAPTKQGDEKQPGGSAK